jgi:hypothetical protein
VCDVSLHNVQLNSKWGLAESEASRTDLRMRGRQGH